MVMFLDSLNFREACETLTGEPLPRSRKNIDRKYPSCLTQGDVKVDWENPEAVFDYWDETGALSYQNVRFRLFNADGSICLSDKGKPDKTFRQRRPDGNNGWIWRLDFHPRDPTPAVETIPYRLPELIAVLAADRTVEVFIVECERKADLLRKYGLTATSIATGTKNFGRLFAGARAIILPDNDRTGSERADFVACEIKPFAATVRIPELPELGDGEDVEDWFSREGATREKLLALADKAGLWASETPKRHQAKTAPQHGVACT
jgi:putative DNA primase/helicase